MTIDKDDLINSIMESLDRIKYIKTGDIPNIDLYMDQVTTFMDLKLRSTTRNPGDDKILTKTMINNYAKNNLLPPPDKKKYSREHILILIFIYYLKGILSFHDIQTILEPLTQKYFESDEDFNLEKIYDEVLCFESEQKDLVKEDILEKFNKAEQVFSDAPEEDKDYFRLFSFITLLGFDVYIKKLLIEKLIDGYRDEKDEESVQKTSREKEREKERAALEKAMKEKALKEKALKEKTIKEKQRQERQKQEKQK